MYKTEFLLLIILIQLCRLVYLKLSRKGTNFLWVSFFIICIPFEFEKLLSHYDPDELTGILGNTFKVTVTSLLPIVLIPFVNWPKFNWKFGLNTWISVVFALSLVSILNPFNNAVLATWYFAFFFLTHFFLFQIFYNILTKSQLIRGLYDGLLILCFAQLVLAICYPVLGMRFVTSLFHNIAAEWATRLDSNRVGAVGFFNHPGNLALFVVLASSFFVSTYMANYRKRLSLFLLICNTITLFFTYSRTSYLTFLIIIFALYYIHKNANKTIFSISTFAKFILPASVILIWLVFFSPISEQFLKSDADTQYTNRLTHYLLALNIFKTSPIFGVGLNSHLAFLASNNSVGNSVTTTGFYFANPIHNIHLIVLAEAGIVGLILWLGFIITNINKAKQQVAMRENQILPMTFIGVLLSFSIYGLTGWTPFSGAILPFFLFIAFFSIRYNIKYK